MTPLEKMTRVRKWWNSPLALVAMALLGLIALETPTAKKVLQLCPSPNCGQYIGNVLEHVFVGIVGALVIWQFLERRTFESLRRAMNYFAASNMGSDEVADAYLALLRREGLTQDEAKSLADALRKRVLNLHEKFDNWFMDITLNPYNANYLRLRIRLSCTFAQTDKTRADIAFAFWPHGDVSEQPYHQRFLISWVFRGAPHASGTPPEAFHVTRVLLGGDNLQLTREVLSDGRVEIRCAESDPRKQNLAGQPIIVDFDVLQARAYGFVSVIAPRMIKNQFAAAINWEDVPQVVGIHPLEMIIGTATLQDVPPMEGQKRLERRFNGVTAKTSQIIFTWSGDARDSPV